MTSKWVKRFQTFDQHVEQCLCSIIFDSSQELGSTSLSKQWIIWFHKFVSNYLLSLDWWEQNKFTCWWGEVTDPSNKQEGNEYLEKVGRKFDDNARNFKDIWKRYFPLKNYYFLMLKVPNTNIDGKCSRICPQTVSCFFSCSSRTSCSLSRNSIWLYVIIRSLPHLVMLSFRTKYIKLLMH